jgi:hypothetical protein
LERLVEMTIFDTRLLYFCGHSVLAFYGNVFGPIDLTSEDPIISDPIAMDPGYRAGNAFTLEEIPILNRELQ